MQTNNNPRVALSKILVLAEYLQTRCGVPKFVANEISEIEQAAKAALAEPIRNCEVGTVQEQDERFHRFCVKHHTGSCAGCHNPVGDYTVANGVRECALVWAQMPYEEGGAK